MEQLHTLFAPLHIQVVVVPIGHISASKFNRCVHLLRETGNEVYLSELKRRKKKNVLTSIDWKNGRMRFNFRISRGKRSTQFRKDEWEELQAHKKTLGVIGVIDCMAESKDGLDRLSARFTEQVSRRFPTSVARKCIAFDPRDDQPDFEADSLPSSTTSTTSISSSTTPIHIVTTDDSSMEKKKKKKKKEKKKKKSGGKTHTSTESSSMNEESVEEESSKANAPDSSSEKSKKEKWRTQRLSSAELGLIDPRMDEVLKAEDSASPRTDLLDRISSTEVVMIPNVGNLNFYLSGLLLDLGRSIFAALETMISSPSDELICVPTDGTGDEDRTRRRMSARTLKQHADLCLLAGSPVDGLEKFQSAIEKCKTHTDWVWTAGAIEGECTCLMLHTLMEHGRNTPVEPNAPLPIIPEIPEKYSQVIAYYKRCNAAVLEVEALLRLAHYFACTGNRMDAFEKLTLATRASKSFAMQERIVVMLQIARMFELMGFHRQHAHATRQAGLMYHKLFASGTPSAHQLLLCAAPHYQLEHLLLGTQQQQQPRVKYRWHSIQLDVLGDLIMVAKGLQDMPSVGRYAALALSILRGTPNLTHEKQVELLQDLVHAAHHISGEAQYLCLHGIPMLSAICANPLEPHLMPRSPPQRKPKSILRRITANNPFHYTPPSFRTMDSDEKNREEVVEWVCGTSASVCVTLRNDFDFDVFLSNVSLVVEGDVPFNTSPVSAVLKARSELTIQLQGHPLSSGSLSLHGVRIECFDLCYTHTCEAYGLKPVNVKVWPSMAYCELQNNLATTHLGLLEGEIKEHPIMLINSGTESVRFIDVVLRAIGGSTQKKGTKKGRGDVHVTSGENSALAELLPLAPGCACAIPLSLIGLPSSSFLSPRYSETIKEVEVEVTYSSANEAQLYPEDGDDVDGDKSIYHVRRAVQSLGLFVGHGLRVDRWNVVPPPLRFKRYTQSSSSSAAPLLVCGAGDGEGSSSMMGIPVEDGVDGHTRVASGPLRAFEERMRGIAEDTSGMPRSLCVPYNATDPLKELVMAANVMLQRAEEQRNPPEDSALKEKHAMGVVESHDLAALVLEVYNPTATTFLLHVLTENNASLWFKSLTINAMSSVEVGLPVAQTPELSVFDGGESAIEFKRRLLKKVALVWTTDFGNVGLVQIPRNLQVTLAMKRSLCCNPMHIDISWDGCERLKEEDFPMKVGKFYDICITVRVNEALSFSESDRYVLVVVPYQSLDTGSENLTLNGKVMWVGTLREYLPNPLPSDGYNKILRICFLATGVYRFQAYLTPAHASATPHKAAPQIWGASVVVAEVED